MKKILISIWVMILSCGCSFLEVENRGKSDTDTFFSEMDGLRTARIGLYNVAYDFYDKYLYKYAEVAGDCVQASVVGSGNDMYYQYNFLSTPDLEATAVGFLWKLGYVVLINANTILNYTDDLIKTYPEYSEEIRSIEAQALFMRALAHFDLVRCYAQPYNHTSGAGHPGVPVVDHVVGTSERLARNTVAEVYAQVIKDLKNAVAILGDAAPEDAHYISGAACLALLARVCLYMEDYSQAEYYATKVISSFPLTPRTDYAAMFTGEETGTEAIFRLTGYYAGTYMKSFYNYESPAYVPIEEFCSEFLPDDVRKGLLESPSGSAAVMKYYDLTGAAPDEWFYNITVLRCSEMYLVRSEARLFQNDLKGASEDLLAVRSRALGTVAGDSDIARMVSSGADAVFSQIKEERKKELCFEGHRFFDLARWNDDIVRPASSNSSARIVRYPDYRYALPIPQVEMDANEAMKQNEGY